ncbi:hypothetical protein K504DRAFT_220971 [Pleomassaria siparia CBS 279.74]|uniref:Uncharacterized protein n=1 Tax=Pleomassaria siparia CBS 279.74 TaxID=1314801 RepID=A0A6G1KFC6_9PLEO|nr:hypothetical protein K504DRAFT_220971 [Pleomassaria siparia CBS 279.74]
MVPRTICRCHAEYIASLFFYPKIFGFHYLDGTARPIEGKCVPTTAWVYCSEVICFYCDLLLFGSELMMLTLNFRTRLGAGESSCFLRVRGRLWPLLQYRISCRITTYFIKVLFFNCGICVRDDGIGCASARLIYSCQPKKIISGDYSRLSPINSQLHRRTRVCALAWTRFPSAQL